MPPGKEKELEHFHMYVPVAKGKPKADKVDILISFFTPGKENALTREDLVSKGEAAGLVNPSSEFKNKDRAMRKLIAKAKLDYNIQITNDGDGECYYIPTPKESVQLARNNKREDKKAISTFKNNKPNKALEEDYKHNRIVGDD